MNLPGLLVNALEWRVGEDRKRNLLVMQRKTIHPKPTKRGGQDAKAWARRAREFSEKLAAGGRRFSDSTDIVRADRDSRV